MPSLACTATVKATCQEPLAATGQQGTALDLRALLLHHLAPGLGAVIATLM
jgi:hypothetical protein